MSSSQHTPGPWLSFRRLGYHSFKIGAPIPGDNNPYTSPELKATARHICNVEFADADMETARANAYLIAAAPELLEACKTALSYIQTEVDIEVKDHGVVAETPMKNTACWLHDILLKAIAKATPSQA